MKRIPLSRPSITESERSRIGDVLDSERLALGPQTKEFEARMAAATSTEFAIAVSSGTAALHIILEAADIGEGDEVITTPFSFVASSNVILYCHAKPIFADIDPVTFNINPKNIADAVTDRTRAILAVDVFGVPAAWASLEQIASSHDMLLLDDACEALGASSDGRSIGSWGDAAAFGFYPNKQITTGEGGCITTNSEEIAVLARSLRNHGRASADKMNHVRLGYNYRIDEMSAALGNAQLDRLSELLNRRKEVAASYTRHLEKSSDLVVIPDYSDSDRSWFVYVIRLQDRFSQTDRDEIISALRRKGIESSPYFPCIHLQPFYREKFGFRRGMFPVAESVSDRTIALPFFPGLSEEDIEYVCSVLVNELTARNAVSVRGAAVQQINR